MLSLFASHNAVPQPPALRFLHNTQPFSARHRYRLVTIANFHFLTDFYMPFQILISLLNAEIVDEEERAEKGMMIWKASIKNGESEGQNSECLLDVDSQDERKKLRASLYLSEKSST